MPLQSSLPHDWWLLQEGLNIIFGVGSISAVTAWSATAQISSQEGKLHIRKIISSWPYRQLKPWGLIIIAISQTLNVHGLKKEKNTYSYPQISRPEESQSPFLFTYAEQNTFFWEIYQVISTENLYPFKLPQKANVTDSWESVTISVTLATRILHDFRVTFFQLLVCVFLVFSFQREGHY